MKAAVSSSGIEERESGGHTRVLFVNLSVCLPNKDLKNWKMNNILRVSLSKTVEWSVDE